MIERLHIENLGVIAAADLELSPGLTVITGETGAGKTMVLSSLAMLLGAAGEPALIRRGAERAVVEGELSVAAEGPAAARAAEAGASVEDGVLIITRVLPSTGRARAHLGGRTVPRAVLREIGAELVTVHGQADQGRLRSPARQRTVVDEAGGPEHAALLEAFRTAFRVARHAEEELATWQETVGAREAEAATLRAELDRIEALSPEPGEDDALRAEAMRRTNVEDLREAAAQAHALSTGEDEAATVTGLLGRARRSLDQAAVHDPALAGWAERLGEASYLVSDVAAELGSYLADLDADPERLAQVHQRRAALADLARSHGSVDAALAWAEEARPRLTDLEAPEDTAERLQAAAALAQQQLQSAAAELTASREAIAQRLEAAVDAELHGLAMGGAHLTVQLTPRETPGPHGGEDVELLLSAHPGAPPRPLGQGASGGELSRVMLALEVALAQSTRLSGGPASSSHAGAGSEERATFVFDEVDAGVGGRAAVEVGRRLARLAETVQVVVVTHLAQVAAFAERHLVVAKHSDDHETVTEVRAVEEEDRVRELARMLSGHEESDTALRHAAELIEQARVRA
ncbi:DNA repair protein RecN [Bogoriella caseilytica]|uniref:DNA repair protein RecN n=1 Tax=Bogoriella caseilytica TaxID=56055 RepID=A0A3N2BG45_9MICO|nr:DNA repair protein RecN [Bogoriella caseilytica]ROR74229.1 DNA replication and repair protein RecN [Bogoriella caseilytica]